MSEHYGKCIIVCAPSGSGKTSIVHHLLEQDFDLAFSVSATTREIRKGEKEGEDYYFLSKKEFEERIKNNDFVEWEEVYDDVFYGTLKNEVGHLWEKGKNVIFDVDVEGGLSLSKYFGEQAMALFIKVPSLKALEERLQKRGTETPEKIVNRLEKAKEELEYEKWFDYVVENKVLETAFKEADQIVGAFLKHT